MAEFGTIEFYEEQLREQRNEKTIYIHALKNLLREQDNRQYIDNYWLIDIIIEKIQSINYWIKSHIEKIRELSSQKDKSETNAD